MAILVGTAGFSYKDWKGEFYPPDVRPPRMLEEYARHFPVVEINSTYYAIPPPERLNDMARRTPPEFQFNVKANREMTHELGDCSSATSEFRAALRPLTDHGKLGCVLAQFPWGFKNTHQNRAYLEALAERLAGLDTVVEFRNSEWEDDSTFKMLSDLGLGYCCVDEPRLGGLLSTRAEVTGRVAYLRLHGRNSETWWDRGRESWERYDYLYTEEELSEWLPKVELMSGCADRTYIIFNNHYKGQAPTNARMFERMLLGVVGGSLVVVDEDTEADDTLF